MSIPNSLTILSPNFCNIYLFSETVLHSSRDILCYSILYNMCYTSYFLYEEKYSSLWCTTSPERWWRFDFHKILTQSVPTMAWLRNRWSPWLSHFQSVVCGPATWASLGAWKKCRIRSPRSEFRIYIQTRASWSTIMLDKLWWPVTPGGLDP